ncbi:MAG: polyamine aminopropyltransferase [bacterium]|nr:polyamine aminopropyltransferase [bacterium]
MSEQEFRETYEGGCFLGFAVEERFVDQQSKFQRIELMRTKSHGVMLALDGLVQLTERDEYVYHEMISHVPLLVHPSPKKVLIIGGGDGGTAREVARHPEVEHVDMCEIDGSVVELCTVYFPTTAIGMKDPKVHVTVGDGIDWVRQTPNETYDVVIIDSSDPVGPGVGLFNSAFYSQVKRILRPGGVVVAQGESPLYQAEAVKALRNAMREVFPITATYLASIPTYPSGLWSFAYASETVNPLAVNLERAHEITKGCKYYNTAIHAAAFALPTHLHWELEQ